MRRYKSPVAILKAARKLIADGQWTRGAMRIGSADGGACYCALGAIDAVTKYDSSEEHYDSYTRLDNAAGPHDAVSLLAESITVAALKQVDFDRTAASYNPQSAVMAYNDRGGRRRTDVVKLFDRAIARAEGAK